MRLGVGSRDKEKEPPFASEKRCGGLVPQDDYSESRSVSCKSQKKIHENTICGDARPPLCGIK